MERKIFTRLFVSAITLVLPLLSCNNGSKSLFKTNNGVELDTLVVEKRYFLDNNPENPSCNLTLNFVYPKNMTHSDVNAVRNVFVNTMLGTNYEGLSVEDAVGKYVANYADNYKNDAEIYRVSKPTHEPIDSTLSTEFGADDDPAYLPEIFYSYYENLSDSIVYNQYGIISYRVKQTNNKGGSMSYETIKNYVVNLSSGKLMDEGDIFSSGYDLALRSIIQASLLEANNVKSIQDLEDLGFFGIDEILPNKNFLITDKGIVYTYNKGEYSAYQLPAAEIFIPYSTVRSLLRENSIASKLSRL